MPAPKESTYNPGPIGWDQSSRSDRAGVSGVAWLLLCVGALWASAVPVQAAPKALGHIASLDPFDLPAAAVVVGGLGDRLEVEGYLCSVAGAPWVAVSKEHDAVVIDTESMAPAWLTLSVLRGRPKSVEACEKSSERVRLFVSQGVVVDSSDIKVAAFVESRLAEASASGLKGMQLVSAMGGRVVSHGRCVSAKRCVAELDIAMLRSWLRGEAGALFAVLPADIPLAPGDVLPALWTEEEAWLESDELMPQDILVELNSSLVGSNEVLVAKNRATVPIAVPEAIAELNCRNARCTLAQDGIELYAIDPDSLTVSLTIKLKPQVVRKAGGRRQSKDPVELALVRCGVRAPTDVPLLAGVSNHRYYVALAKECYAGRAEDLHVRTWPPTYAYIRGEVEGADPGWRYYEVILQKTPERARTMKLTLGRRKPQRISLGAVELSVGRGYQPVSMTLVLPELGVSDFIPRNRHATLRMSFDEPHWHRLVKAVGRRGMYQVKNDGPLQQVRAVRGASGTVAMRLAYVPPALQSFLGRSKQLAIIDTGVLFSVGTVSIPLDLNATADSSDHFVRVTCQRGDRKVFVQPGRTMSLPFGDRHSCRLVIDQQAIPEWAGSQRLKVRSGRINEVITAAYGGERISIALPVEGKKEFDSLSLSLSHEYSTGNYAFAARHSIGAEAHYRLILGDRRFRASVGTSMPTSLFRFGAGDNRGSVPLSAGALARMSWVQDEGREFPIGWELGILGTGLSGEPHLSFVSGLGLTVPVLNANTPLQTSFNLHAWLEFSPTRHVKDGGRWAFLFGPSFGVGKFSTSL